jgi:hypothetical protein
MISIALGSNPCTLHRSPNAPLTASHGRLLCSRHRGGFVLWLMICLLGVVAEAQSATEYQVKAAYLFNFAKFVDWPADSFPAPDSSFLICVLGQDPFGRDFEQLITEKAVNGRRIEVAHPEGVVQARACQIVFLGMNEKQAQATLQGLKGANVLTVGDAAGFAKMGGVIGFVLDDNRVRFEINQKAAEQAHLRLSARLLTVAKAVVVGE